MSGAAAFQWGEYREALLFLGTAGVVAPLFHRLRISPILGFLLAGAALGPFGLGKLAERHALLSAIALSDLEGVAKIAEFGLVFLLFMIGLELSWERLARMRTLVFGLGLSQVLLCGGALTAAGVFWAGLGPRRRRCSARRSQCPPRRSSFRCSPSAGASIAPPAAPPSRCCCCRI